MSNKELAANHGSADLLIAAIMRHTGCSEEAATEHYYTYWIDFDRLMEVGLVDDADEDEDEE